MPDAGRESRGDGDGTRGGGGEGISRGGRDGLWGARYGSVGLMEGPGGPRRTGGVVVPGSDQTCREGVLEGSGTVGPVLRGRHGCVELSGGREWYDRRNGVRVRGRDAPYSSCGLRLGSDGGRTVRSGEGTRTLSVKVETTQRFDGRDGRSRGFTFRRHSVGVLPFSNNVWTQGRRTPSRPPLYW